MQQVKLLRIVVAHSLGPMVAQKVVQLLERRRKIGIPNAIHHVDIFARVQMVQPQMVLLRASYRRRSGLTRLRGAAKTKQCYRNRDRRYSAALKDLLHS